MQKTLVTQRNLIIGLCVFAVILALANMGTAVSHCVKYCMQFWNCRVTPSAILNR